MGPKSYQSYGLPWLKFLPELIQRSCVGVWDIPVFRTGWDGTTDSLSPIRTASGQVSVKPGLSQRAKEPTEASAVDRASRGGGGDDATV